MEKGGLGMEDRRGLSSNALWDNRKLQELVLALTPAIGYPWILVAYTAYAQKRKLLIYNVSFFNIFYWYFPLDISVLLVY